MPLVNIRPWLSPRRLGLTLLGESRQAWRSGPAAYARHLRAATASFPKPTLIGLRMKPRQSVRPHPFIIFLSCIAVLLLAACSGITGKSAKSSSRSPEYIEREVERLLAALTLAEKISLVHANSKFTVAGVPRLGIPEMTLSDGPHGVREEISRHSWDSANWETD